MHAPAYKSLADALRAQITSGRLRPGDRLPTEPQLCRSAGVSRSTVREALRLLTSQHLVVTVRGVAGGSFVAHPSPAQLAESLCTGVRLWQATSGLAVAQLLEVREMVEVPATGLAALRRTDRHLEALAAALFDPWTAEHDAMLDLHYVFHATIAAASGNPLIELVTLPLHAVADPRALTASLSRDFWARVDSAHRAILAAVAAGQVAEAEAAALAHLRDLGLAAPGLATQGAPVAPGVSGSDGA